jgi:hypothetical protein
MKGQKNERGKNNFTSNLILLTFKKSPGTKIQKAWEKIPSLE